MHAHTRAERQAEKIGQHRAGQEVILPVHVLKATEALSPFFPFKCTLLRIKQGLQYISLTHLASALYLPGTLLTVVLKLFHVKDPKLTLINEP